MRELPPNPGGRVNLDEVVVWTDGGARGNPGPAGFGVVVTTPSGEVLTQLAEGIGWATNNVAEYRGAIAGPEQALALGARRVRVRADSLLVVNQQKGLWKVRNAASGTCGPRPAAVGQFDRVIWEHVPRERNRMPKRSPTGRWTPREWSSGGRGSAASLKNGRAFAQPPDAVLSIHAGSPLFLPSQPNNQVRWQLPGALTRRLWSSGSHRPETVEGAFCVRDPRRLQRRRGGRPVPRRDVGGHRAGGRSDRYLDQPDDAHRVRLGHRRLSIIDLSAAATSRSSRMDWCWCSAVRLQLPELRSELRTPASASARLRHRGAAGGVAPLGAGQPAPPARHVRLRAVRRAPGDAHPGP